MIAEPASRPRLLILGAGSFGPEVAALAECDGRYEAVAYVESLDRSKVGQTMAGLPIVWDDEIVDLAHTHLVVCALGSTQRRQWIERVAALGFDFATIQHPSAQVLRGSTIGKGSIIGAGVVVAAGTRIGEHVIVNRGSLVGHHVTVGDYVTISPGANIGGSTRIGSQTFIGMGAILLNNLTIGAGATVGAAALVSQELPEGAQVLGRPARISTRGAISD